MGEKSKLRHIKREEEKDYKQVTQKEMKGRVENANDMKINEKGYQKKRGGKMKGMMRG